MHPVNLLVPLLVLAAGSARAAGTDLSVAGFTCDAPTVLGYLPGDTVTTTCTVPITVSHVLVSDVVARIRIESLTVTFNAATGYFTVVKHGSRAVHEWDVSGTETTDQTVTLNGLDPTSGLSIDAWLAGEYALGRKLRLAVTVDDDAQIIEADEVNNSAVMSVVPAGFFLTPLVPVVRFGPVVTTLTAGHVVRSGAGCCAPGALELVTGSTIDWAPGGTFTPQTITTGALVVTQFAASSSGLELAAVTPVTVPAIVGSFGGLSGDIKVTLDERGIKPGVLSLTLPPGHSYHAAGILGNPLPRGQRKLVFTAPKVKRASDLTTVQAQLKGGFLHGGHLPFYLALNVLAVSANSVGGDYFGTHYVHDLGFLPGDSRSVVDGLPRVVTNDIRFGPAAVSLKRRSFRLAADGLATTIVLAAGSGEAHFPRMHLEWPAYSVVVKAGALRDRQTLPADLADALVQSPDCPLCPTAADGTDFVLTPVGKMALGSDGAVIASLTGLPSPRWGPVVDGDSHVFERSAEPGTGKLFIPGFTMVGTSRGASVPEVLLGARAVVSEGGVVKPAHQYSVSDDEARRGNHFAAGITVGPERYSAVATGAPVVGLGANLAGSISDIWFGGTGGDGGCSGACEVIASIGTKYVVRPAGVTGAFNAGTPPSPTVYGFELPFLRFAFRQYLNDVDDLTWNDGSVHVETPGGFDVAFKSMALECTGALGDAPVVPCDPSVADAPNCDEDLDAWQTPMTPLTLSFVAAVDEEVCSPGERDLEVGAEVVIAALDDPIGVTAVWSPNGNPSDERITGHSDNVLERPTNPSSAREDEGFPVALHEAVLLEHAGNTSGWFVFNMDFAVPFFDLINADVRLENATLDTPAATVVRAGDGSGVPDKALDWADVPPCDAANLDGCAPRATYTWGGTGFVIDLPVYFDTDQSGMLKPRFSGITLEHSVAVMQVNAGVDYATPDAVHLTFGASADFASLELSDLVLSIDLDDALAIAGVDQFLVGHDIDLVDGKGPIGAIVDGVRGKTDALLELVGDATEGQLRLVIEEQIDLMASGLSVRFFDDVVDLVLGVKGLTGLIASEVTAAFSELLVDLLAPFTTQLDAEVAAAYDLIVTLFAATDVVPCDTAVPAGACDEALAQVRALIAALEVAKALLDGLSDAGLGAIADARAAVDGLVFEAGNDIQDALAISKQLRLEVLGAGGVADLTTQDTTVNPLYVFLLLTAAPGVADVLDEMQALELVENAQRLASLIPLPVDTGEIQSDLIGRAVDLMDEYDVLIPSLTASLEVIDLDAVLAGPIDFALDMESTLLAIDGELGDVEAAIDGPLDTLEAAIDVDSRALEDLITLLEDIEAAIVCAQTSGCTTDFSGLLKAALDAKLDAAVSDASDGAITDFAYKVDGVTHTFVLALPDFLREAFDQAVADLTVNPATTIGGLLPSIDLLPALTTGADLRLMIIDLIMSSGGVESMLVEFAAHFDLLVEDVTLLVDDLFAQVEAMLADIAAALNDAAAAALAAANSVIDDIMPELPISAASLDGYALIAGDELERLHVGAAFTMTGSQEDDSRTFEAALDVTSWATNGKGDACDPSAEASALLDAVISTKDLPLKIGTGEVTIEDLHLGFTLEGDGSGPPMVVGVFGGITTDGSIDFTDFSIYDIGFEAGAGAYETYVGATASASFSSMSLSVTFLVGKTCNDAVLEALDPQAAEFITLPGGIFNGVYVRGGASMPIIDFGCLLNLSLAADVGTWLLGGPPLTLGGLVGGGAFGKLGCIGALRGQATAFAELSGDQVKFRGEGFGIAGLGLDCDPETWTTIAKSRDDKSCGTGDAGMSLTYDNGKWIVPKPNVSAVH